MGDPRSDDLQTTELALAAGAGDRTALAAFIRATQRDVYRFVCHLCARDEAEDLTQETYLRALRALPRFAGRAAAQTWLLTIARRVCADHVRSAVRDRRLAAAAALAGGAPAPVPDASEAVAVRALLAGLDPDRREAFVLTQLVGLSYPEAAEVCGCPVGTIRSRVARARGDLVRILDQGSALSG
jgi:RNA polymerase sigma-70 factor (ECF subfamily)